MSRHLVVGLLLALITVLVYLPLRNHDFVNYDDPGLVTDNPLVQRGVTWQGVRWAFTTTRTGNWHPVTWLSHMLDCELFGLRPGAHHLVSATLHAANAVLVFILLRYLTSALWPSALVAALFAWHPLRVQSVAWAAERKDVLSAFFALLSLLAYARYVRSRAQPGRPHVTGQARAGYAWALIFFALGLMAKPMLVTLPFIMLLLDYWPLARLATTRPVEPERHGRGANASRKPAVAAASVSGWHARRVLLVEKWPFFALAAVSCVVALVAQAQSKVLISLAHHPLEMRLKNTGVAYVDYLVKTVYPANLAVFYPPRQTISWLALAGAVVALGAVSWAIWSARRRLPCLLVGWLWFLGMLVPVIGLVQVGDQFNADRYTYLPSIGLFTAVVFGLADLVVSRRIGPAIWASVGAAVLIACLWATRWQLSFWKDGETLFSRAASVTPSNSIALNNLGGILLQRGRVDEAIDRLRQAVASEPGNAKAQNNLGLALARQGRLDEAEQCYRNAVQIDPQYVRAHENLGTLYLQTNRLDKAIASLLAATEIEPSAAKAFNDLGVAYMKSGRAADGLSAFQHAVAIQPTNARFRANLGHALMQMGRTSEAKPYLGR